MKALNYLAVSAVVIWLSGCMTLRLVPPGPTEFGKFTVDNPSEWSELQRTWGTIWTKDGERLNRLAVYEVSDGQHIFKSRVTDQNKAFVYKADMDLEDALELYVDAMKTDGFINVSLESTNNRIVGDHEAVEFELIYDTEENLRYKEIGLFAKIDNSLQVIFGVAPSEHYFPFHEPTFRKIISSARIE